MVNGVGGGAGWVGGFCYTTRLAIRADNIGKMSFRYWFRLARLALRTPDGLFMYEEKR